MTPFDVEALAAIAQLGLGLAGFSGIGLLLTRTSGRLQQFELHRLGIMLGTAVGAMVLALVPLLLAAFDLGPGVVCRVAVLVMAGFEVGFLAYYLTALRYFRRVVPEIVGRIAAPAVTAGHAASLVLLVLATVGVLERCAGVYTAGLLWLLAHGTYQFWRIISVRPRDPETTP